MPGRRDRTDGRTPTPTRAEHRTRPPLRETGHDDRASLLVVAGCSAVVFGLAALALGRATVHPLRGALLRAPVVLCGALVLQAVSLELVRQATLGLDWNAALLRLDRT